METIATRSGSQKLAKINSSTMWGIIFLVLALCYNKANAFL
jgi:hypothetical protein